MWWSPNPALEQVSNPVLQDVIGGRPDRVPHALGFEELVHLGIGEGRVAPEIEPPQKSAAAPPFSCGIDYFTHPVLPGASTLARFFTDD